MGNNKSRKIKQPVQRGVAKVPVVMQMEALECGAASLTMVMAYYDKWVPLEQVREDCDVSRDGAKADMAFAPSGSSSHIERQAAPIEIRIMPLMTHTAEKPSILIYHTHTHEAYEQVSDDPYEALEAWRTTDADHSVVRVGDELARLLEDFGFEVTHDATDHEGSDLSTAYTRSLLTPSASRASPTWKCSLASCMSWMPRQYRCAWTTTCR